MPPHIRKCGFLQSQPHRMLITCNLVKKKKKKGKKGKKKKSSEPLTELSEYLGTDAGWCPNRWGALPYKPQSFIPLPVHTLSAPDGGALPLILCLEDHYLDNKRQRQPHLPQIVASLACIQGSLLTLSTGQTTAQMVPPLRGFPYVHGQRSTGAPTAPCVSLCHPSHTARSSPLGPPVFTFNVPCVTLTECELGTVPMPSLLSVL